MNCRTNRPQKMPLRDPFTIAADASDVPEAGCRLCSLRIQIPWIYEQTDGGSLPDRYHRNGAQRRKCSTALLLIDVINDMEFPDGGDQLLRQTLPAARKIATLKKRAVAAGVPV